MLRLLPVLLLLLLVPATAQAAPNQVMSFEAPAELLDDRSRDATLDEIRALGVTRVRALVYWSRFSARPESRTPPRFDTTNPDAYPPGTWALLDRLVASTQARGIELQLTLTGRVPKWATKRRRDNVTEPSAKWFGRWVQAVATRYGEHVDLWSVWNEPNHPDFLRPQYRKGKPYSPRLYRQLYVAAERALHGVPGGRRDVVLFGETAPIGNVNLVSPIDFLRGALCLNGSWKKARGCRKVRIDGYAHHAYGRKGSPTFRSTEGDEVSLGSLDRLIRALDKAGKAGAIDRDRPVYLTEFGVQSAPDTIAGVSLAKQAEYLAISEHIAYLNPRVKAFSQYLMRDDQPRKGVPRSVRFPGFETGLRRSNGRKKPSYTGFMLPLRVTRAGSSHVLWGRVRPATEPVDVTIERSLARKAWKRLTQTRTGAGGVFGFGTRSAAKARYRVRWTRADGRTFTGPPIRPY